MTPAVHATIVMVLSARAHPAIKPPPPETFTETVADGEILKVFPRGELYTTQSDDHGKTIQRAPKDLLRYYFLVAIKNGVAVLTQVADEYGKTDFFDLDDRLPSDGYGEKRTFSLKPGKPVSFSFNVPGGGPAWTLTLQSLK
jgi:hypothetical protein